MHALFVNSVVVNDINSLLDVDNGPLFASLIFVAELIFFLLVWGLFRVSLKDHLSLDASLFDILFQFLEGIIRW